MGTKNTPGAFDCYAKAEPDEPLFTLLGRDHEASPLVQAWALMRWAIGEHRDIVTEALDCAGRMALHARAYHSAVPTGMREAMHRRILEALTFGMEIHPLGYTGPCACRRCLEVAGRVEEMRDYEAGFGRDQWVALCKPVSDLIDELTTAVDNNAEDIGGSRKELDILRDLVQAWRPMRDAVEAR